MSQYFRQPTNTITGQKDTTDVTHYVKRTLSNESDFSYFDLVYDSTMLNTVVISKWDTPNVIFAMTTSTSFLSDYVEIPKIQESTPIIVPTRLQDSTGAWWELGVGPDGSMMPLGPYAARTGTTPFGNGG